MGQFVKTGLSQDVLSLMAGKGRGLSPIHPVLMEQDDVTIVGSSTCHRRYGAPPDTGTSELMVAPNTPEMHPEGAGLSMMGILKEVVQGVFFTGPP